MKQKIFKIIKTSQLRCLFLLFIVLSIYLVQNLPIIKFGNSSVFIYIIQPIIWGIAIVMVFLFPRIRSKGKLRIKSVIRWWAFYLGFVYILFMFLGGVVEGFGKSPYDLSPLGIIKNIIVFGSALVGRELVRGYLVNSTAKKHPVLTMGIIVVLMTLISLPIERITGLKTGVETIQYIGENFLPELTKNILATYLVYIAGPAPSIIYLSILQGFMWFCPILPNIKWITKALLGTLCPAFSLMFIQYIYGKESRELGQNQDKRENPLGWILTSLVSVCLVWFTVGVFPIHPSVIATGSMKPMIQPGDVVLVRNIDSRGIKLKDVVQYKKDNIFIFHRVIEIKQDNKGIKYVTKGDNNTIPDSALVDPGMIKGIIIKVIPKIGWPTLLLKSKNNVPKEKVEF